MTTLLTLDAVIWDMDGVIVDTFDGHYHAWNKIFDELGHPFTLEDFRRTFGMNNRLILDTLLGSALPEAEFQLVSERKELYFRDTFRESERLLPGVRDLLEKFRALGVKQAVGSSAPQENIDLALDALDVRAFFDAVAAGATLRGKPDPAVFLLAAERLGVDPEHCLVIEDSVAGVEAARRGGMKCVAVCTTNTAEKVASADVVLNDLTELTEDILKQIFQF